MNDIRRFLDGAFPYLLLLPAVVPIIWVGGVLYPFITPKVLLVRADALLTLGVFLYLALTGRAFYYGRIKNWLTWIPAALLLIAYVTSAFGADFSVSFWSTYVRGDGLLTYSALVIFFYGTLLIADRAFLVRLFKVVAVIGSAAALLGLLQWLMGGNLPFLPPADGRIASSLGNAAYLAAYLSMTAFATFAVSFELRSKTWRTWTLVSAWLQLVAVILTATRGSIVALFAVAIVWLLWKAWKGEGKGTRRNAAVTLIALVILAGGFALLRDSFTHSSFGPIQRLASISTSDPDVSSRLFIWQHVFAETIATGHEWLGYGAEHITIPFDRVYDPTKLVEEWFDRTHDAYLDYLVQSGFLGVIAYLLLIGAAFSALVRAYLRKEKLAGALSLMVIAYAVQNVFIFDTDSPFWLLLIALVAAVVFTTPSEKSEPFSFTIPAWAALLLPVLAVVALWWVVWLPLYANILLTDAYSHQFTNPARSDTDLAKGFALGTYGNLEYGYTVYDMYTSQVSTLTGSALDGAYAIALQILSANYARYPYDARTAVYLSQVLALSPSSSPPDPAFEQQVFTRAMRLSPGRAQPWYLEVNLALSTASSYPQNSPARASYYQDAVTTLTQYESLEPGVSETHFVLAQLYEALGNATSASQEAALGKATYTPDLTTALRAASYYENVKDWADTAYFLESAIALSPTDYSDDYDLAKVLYLEGNLAASDAIVNKLRTVDPSIVPTDANFYAAITAYEHGQQ